MGDYKVRVMLGSELMADEDVQVAAHALDSVYSSKQPASAENQTMSGLVFFMKILRNMTDYAKNT